MELFQQIYKFHELDKYLFLLRRNTFGYYSVLILELQPNKVGYYFGVWTQKTRTCDPGFLLSVTTSYGAVRTRPWCGTAKILIYPVKQKTRNLSIPGKP